VRKSIISFNGKTPSEQEREQLTQEAFDKTLFSFVEHNRKIKEGLICFLSGSGAVILSLFFWTKTTFSTLALWGRFAVPLLGFGLALFCLGLNRFHNRPTKQKFKKPQQALQQYVKCILDIKYFHIGTIDTGNSYATLQRILPKSQRINYETFTTYLKALHLEMEELVRNDAKTLNLFEKSFKVSAVNTSIVSNKTVSKSVEKLTMSVDLYVENTQLAHPTWRNKFMHNRVSHIKLIFNMTLVQLNKYWFVYDPLPDYKINNP